MHDCDTAHSERVYLLREYMSLKHRALDAVLACVLVECGFDTAPVVETPSERNVPPECLTRLAVSGVAAVDQKRGIASSIGEDPHVDRCWSWANLKPFCLPLSAYGRVNARCLGTHVLFGSAIDVLDTVMDSSKNYVGSLPCSGTAALCSTTERLAKDNQGARKCTLRLGASESRITPSDQHLPRSLLPTVPQQGHRTFRYAAARPARPGDGPVERPTAATGHPTVRYRTRSQGFGDHDEAGCLVLTARIRLVLAWVVLLARSSQAWDSSDDPTGAGRVGRWQDPQGCDRKLTRPQARVPLRHQHEIRRSTTPLCPSPVAGHHVGDWQLQEIHAVIVESISLDESIEIRADVDPSASSNISTVHAVVAFALLRGVVDLMKSLLAPPSVPKRAREGCGKTLITVGPGGRVSTQRLT
ncbi:hypothetical protein MRB53_038044 [Persea americana]|nr:hypothetical protein MRB53_038044 [Persea americana]